MAEEFKTQVEARIDSAVDKVKDSCNADQKKLEQCNKQAEKLRSTLKGIILQDDILDEDKITDDEWKEVFSSLSSNSSQRNLLKEFSIDSYEDLLNFVYNITKIETRKVREAANEGMERILSQKEVWGIPTVIITPDVLHQIKEEYKTTWEKKNGKPITAGGWQAFTPLNELKKQYFNNLLSEIKSIANELGEVEIGILYSKLDSHSPVKAPLTVRLPIEISSQGSADKLGREQYQEADAAVTILPQSNIEPKKWVSYFLSDYPNVTFYPDDIQGNIPGTSEQWRLLISLHELSHISGAGEAQADMMAATQYMQIMGNKDGVIQAFSDIRAIDSVLRYNNEKQSSEYGWATVSKLDLISVDGVSIDAISEIEQERLHDMRFDELAHHEKHATAFAEALKQANPNAFASRDFVQLANTTKTLLSNNTFGEIPHVGREWNIAKRFLEATSRISGIKKYLFRYE